MAGELENGGDSLALLFGELARARIEQTMARDDWQLRATVQAQRSTGGFFSGQQVDQSLFYQHNVDVFRQVSTGGTVTFHTDSTFNSVSFVDPLADNILGAKNWNHSVNASFVQPLLRGRGKWLWEANERRATLSQDVTVLQRRIATIQSVQQIVSAYWDLILAERQVGITRASLDLAKERLRITQIGADGGKIPRSEIPAVQQIIATREEDVLNGELLVLDRSITLRRLTNLPIGKGELGLRIGGDLTIGGTAGDLGQLTERAYQAAPELAQLAKQDKIAQLDVEVSENGLLTRLDAALTIGPTGQDGAFIHAKKMTLPSKENLGQVGEIESIDPAVIEALEAGGFIPVVAPIATGRDGTTYNINADLVAGDVAAALFAEKLIHLTDVTGINGEDGRLVSTLTKREAERLIKAGVIDGGMLPKVESSLRALTGGAQKAHIIDGRVPHAILLEVLTKLVDQGPGYEIHEFVPVE